MNHTAAILSALLLAPVATLHAADASADAKPARFFVCDLKVDYRVNPFGLEARHPRFFWRINYGDQTAWQAQATSSAENLAAGNAELWDSGKRVGAETTQIAYEGKPLVSRQRVWWRVRAWNKAGKESPWSEPAFFEMGLLSNADWRGAQWIGCNRDYETPQPAPVELMGSWITAQDNKAVTGFFKDVVLPNKPVVNAMAWWGLSKPARPASVVANFDELRGSKRSPMLRIMRPRQSGGADLAFYLFPGSTNRVEVRLEKPTINIAATLGMKIVFADGEEMLLASGPDWRVRWAEAKRPADAVKVADAYSGGKLGTTSSFPQTDLPPAWFRTTLNVRDGLARARLYLCALGQGQSFVNGFGVDDNLLSPPQSDYEELGFYTVQDITRLLKPGANALAVLLDAGWYHEVGGFGTAFSYGRPGLKALVALDYADGKTEWITSGTDWQWKEGAIRSANIYRGERVDFRRDHDEWKSPGAGAGWQPAQILPPRTPKTIATDIVPVRRDGELKPIKRWQTGPKTWLFDVGEMIHGWVRFTVAEPSGKTVRLRCSEFAKDGVMENVPVSQWWCHGVTQGDEIICDGTARVFEPQFATKSFRWVEVSGVSREPADLVAVPVHTAAPALATFESSDPMLNRLFANGMRTFRNYLNNMLGDIPRERNLWGAESIYSEVPAHYCFDWAPNHRLMNLLWCTGTMAPGGIPGNVGLGKRLTIHASSFNWSVTPLFISSKLFEHYGDIEPARMFYDKLRHLLLYTEKTGEEGGTIPALHQLSDHAPARDIVRAVPANGSLINALVFFEAQHRFARIADALGKTEDAAHARAHAEKIRATIMGFYDAARHTFGNGTHDSLALAYGAIADAAERKALAASLVGYYRANGHQFDGGFMSYEIYPQLSRHGYVDDAIKMLVNTEPPGPAWSVKKYDATSFWETYFLDHDAQMNRGLDFIAFAHSIGWMITDLAGIRYAPGVPNGKRMLLAPEVPRAGTPSHVKAAVETPAGTVRSSWSLKDEMLTWEFTVPANVTAEVRVPADDASTVKGVEGLKSLGYHDGQARYEAGRGTYSIRGRLARRVPVAPTPTAKQDAAKAAIGDAKEWKVSPGCSARCEEGCLLVTPGQGPTQMLTTTLPLFIGGKTTLRFRLKTAAKDSGFVRLVSVVAGKKGVQTLEFKLGPAGMWREYAVAIPHFEGKPFSLWIGLAREKEALTFDEISLVDANGKTLKRWSF